LYQVLNETQPVSFFCHNVTAFWSGRLTMPIEYLKLPQFKSTERFPRKNSLSLMFAPLQNAHIFSRVFKMQKSSRQAPFMNIMFLTLR